MYSCVPKPFEFRDVLIENQKNIWFWIHVLFENHSELLLFIISSLEGKKWTDLHPEHLRLIIEGIKKYKDGKIFNKIIMEIISENNII